MLDMVRRDFACLSPEEYEQSELWAPQLIHLHRSSGW